jgi:hypothetical protein
MEITMRRFQAQLNVERLEERRPARVVVSDAGSIPVRDSATPGQGLRLPDLDVGEVLSNLNL